MCNLQSKSCTIGKKDDSWAVSWVSCMMGVLSLLCLNSVLYRTIIIRYYTELCVFRPPCLLQGRRYKYMFLQLRLECKMVIKSSLVARSCTYFLFGESTNCSRRDYFGFLFRRWCCMWCHSRNVLQLPHGKGAVWSRFSPLSLSSNYAHRSFYLVQFSLA